MSDSDIGEHLLLTYEWCDAPGLCNGTRLLYRGVSPGDVYIRCTIISGHQSQRGRDVLIPRIDLAPDESMYAFSWVRRQFPVRVAFAMTINKSQGNDIMRVLAV